jgi:predicted permease
MNGEPFPIESLLPIFVYFLIGLAFRKSGIATSGHADFLFRIVFVVTLPALVFMSVAQADLGPNTLLLPVSGFLINLVCAAIAGAVARLRGFPATDAGAVVVCAGIMNMGFTFPFILATLGQAALAEAILFDVGNAIFVAALAYPIAQYYGQRKVSFSSGFVMKVVMSPIFIAIVAALIVNLAHIDTGPILDATLLPLGSATIPLMLIAVGMSFGGLSGYLSDAVLVAVLRMLLGASLGLASVWLFDLQGLTAVVVAVSAAAPVGASAAAIAAVSGLNKELAVTAISVTAIAGLVSTSALLFLASRLFG